MTDTVDGGPEQSDQTFKPGGPDSGAHAEFPEHPDGMFTVGQKLVLRALGGSGEPGEETELQDDPELEAQLLEALLPLDTVTKNIEQSDLPDEIKERRISQINKRRSDLEKRLKKEWLITGELRGRLSDFVADGFLPLLCGEENHDDPDEPTTIMELTPVNGGYRVGALEGVFPHAVVGAVLEEMYIMAGTTAPSGQEPNKFDEGEKSVVRIVVPGTMEGLWLAEEKIYPSNHGQQELTKLERIRIVGQFKK